MGGRAQMDWEHNVPKTRRAVGLRRISIPATLVKGLLEITEAVKCSLRLAG